MLNSRPHTDQEKALAYLIRKMLAETPGTLEAKAKEAARLIWIGVQEGLISDSQSVVERVLKLATI